MKRILHICITLLFTQAIVAQNVEEQVLVYRNTGEINLFFAHELDSIVLSYYDKDSIQYEDFVSQAFCTPDSVYLIPLNEIDSVAFGARNEAEFYEDVRILTEEDSAWIIRYDGHNIYYQKNTPPDILPQKEEKLFYGKRDFLFPIGLMAKVDDVVFINDEYKITIRDIEIDDIFSKLFYAGSINLPDGQAKTRAFNIDDFHIDVNLPPIEPAEGIKLALNAGVTINAKIVCNPLIGYYCMEGYLENNIDANISCSTEKGFGEDEISYTCPGLTFPLGTYAFVFQPSIDISAFIDIKAELTASLKTNRYAKQHFSYIKRANKDKEFQLVPVDSKEAGTSSEVDIICSGEVFYGAQCIFDFGVIGDIAGAKLKTKIGPSFQGEVSMSFIKKASKEYQPEIYGAANLSSSIKLSAEGIAYTRDLVWGTVKEYKLFELTTSFRKAKLDLFPHFFQTRAVKSIIKDAVSEISASTKSDNVIPCTLETGFELVGENNIVLDSVYIAEIEAENTKVQGLSTEFNLASISLNYDSLKVRPTFHYAGHTIPADFASVMSDSNIQLIAFGISNGAINVVSGAPYIGCVKGIETTYIAGPYTPTYVQDTIFAKVDIFHGSYIDAEELNFFGTWRGNEAGTTVSYTFNEDESGAFVIRGQTIPFGYKINYPQNGQITINFNEGKGTKILYIQTYSAVTLSYRTERTSDIYTINKVDL